MTFFRSGFSGFQLEFFNLFTKVCFIVYGRHILYSLKGISSSFYYFWDEKRKKISIRFWIIFAAWFDQFI